MFGTGRGAPKPALATAVLAGVVLAAGACSDSGGKAAEEEAAGAGAGRAGTPTMTVAYITHSSPGDTFWDIVRKGAETAAAKDNVELKISSNPDGGEQANLVQNAIDSGVDGIAVTMSHPEPLIPVIRRAIDAGIPVVSFNAGQDQWQRAGALSYFGSDEALAGEAAGRRAAAEGFRKILCVPHEQGSVSLEARCDGVTSGFAGGRTEKLYVNGTDMPSVRSTIAAKLTQDPAIDLVITLGAPFALAAVDSVKDAGSPAKIATFDNNTELPAAIKSGAVQWMVDQQPYLQGYLAVDSLWLYRSNGNVIGGGRLVLTGPSFVDESNIADVERFSAAGTR